MSDLTHTDDLGTARMVDVTGKEPTNRNAIASGAIVMSPATLDAIRSNSLKKGDVLSVARVAAILAAKKTAELIPLCHPIGLTDIQVDFELDDSLPGIRIRTSARTADRTGIEMEALTAAAIGLLTVYDMAKAIDRGMIISSVCLEEKSGGSSGDWKR